MADVQWTHSDSTLMAALGIDEADVREQLERFRSGPAVMTLDRPCTVGDGVRCLSEWDQSQCVAAWEKAARSGRFVKFVPASGAATRMFQALFWALKPESPSNWSSMLAAADLGNDQARAFVRFWKNIERFPFFEDWIGAMAKAGKDVRGCLEKNDFRSALPYLLDEEGLGLGKLPKALIPFHRYPQGNRTALEEHIVEAIQYATDAGGISRLHVTVDPSRLDLVRSSLDGFRSRYENSDCRLEAHLSCQDPSTHTIAVDLDNQPFRDDEGRLVFRPSGHGALLKNLNEGRFDLVFIKNIDNVVPDDRKEVTILWKKVLGGLLVTLQKRIHHFIARIEAGDDRAVPEALSFVQDEFGCRMATRGETEDELREVLLDRLDRPLRVCGVVRNVGEPGGGPFWVRHEDGLTSLQIVEKAQVDMEDEDQKAIWNASTHFNPVDLACALRDPAGEPYDLFRFQDPDAVIITTKSVRGRPLKALERPGLWNGSMAQWNTVFVEVPEETFNPVKSVNDLLRPAHQPRT